jgi:WD40 repeat protein
MSDPIEKTEVAPERRDAIPPTRLAATSARYYFLAPPQQPDEVGRLGAYRVLRELGSGGMGVVFQAEDSLLKRPVALKVLKADLAADEGSRQRFLREARLAAAIEHDHIVPVYQIGEDRGVIFLAMPLLRGETLGERLRREKALPLPEVLRIGGEIAAGLAAAHERGLIHRDIKPANIWLEAGSGRVKVLDFGLARRESAQAVGRGEDTIPLTQEGAILGTPGFMAPEQARGEKVDHRCDLFSLGCVLYALCSGELPFKGADAISVLLAVTMEEPRPLLACNPGLRPDLCALVMQMLSKDPAGRPQSAAAVVAALQAMETNDAPTETLKLPSTATLIAPRAGVVAARRGGHWARILLVGLALLLAVGVWLGLYHWTKKPAPPPAPNPLDMLDPGLIPAAERFDWQPKELVAVLGQHGGRHWLTIRDVAFSPDAARLASCGNGSIIHLWDARSLRELEVLRGHQKAVHHLVFSPNGKYLASSSADETVRLWEVVEGKGRQLKSFPAAANEPAFSADSGRLAFAGKDGTVWVYDLARRQPEELTSREVKHTGNANFVAFAPDGKTLVSREANGTVLVHDLSGQRWKRPAAKLASGAVSVLFAGSGLLVCGNKEGNVWLCDLGKKERPEELPKIKGHNANVVHLALSPSGQVLASADADGKVQLWNVPQSATGRLEARGDPVAVHPDGLRWVAFAGDDQTLAAIGRGKRTVRLWSLVKGKLERPIEFPADYQGVNSLAFAPSGKTLVTGGEDRAVRLWDVADGKAVEKLPGDGHAYWVSSVAFSPDGKALASGGRDNVVRLWDLTAAPPKAQVLFKDGSVVGSVRLAFTAGGKLASAHPDGSVRLWDPAGDAGKPAVLLGTVKEPNALAVARSGRRLAVSELVRETKDGKTTTVRGGVQVWDLTGERPSEPKALPGLLPSTDALAFTEDGNRLVSGSSDGTLRLWDLTAAEPKQIAQCQGHGKVVWAAALTPDGRTLVSSGAGADNVVKVWDLAGDRFEERRVFQGHTAAPRALALTRDGKTIVASGDTTGWVIVWDAASGEKLREWHLHGAVAALAFADDGRHLALGNANGTTYVLRLPAADEESTNP